MAYPKERASDLIDEALRLDSPCYGLDDEVYRALQTEMGGTESAMSWLAARLRPLQKVILIISRLPDGRSQSVVVPPPDWDAERLKAEIARLRPLLEGIGPLESMAIKRGIWQG